MSANRSGHSTTAAPAHVPANLVFDVDLYGDLNLAVDLHATMAALHDSCPDIFFTPRHGGCWVLTRAEFIERVMADTDCFKPIQGPIGASGDEERLSAVAATDKLVWAALIDRLGPGGLDGLMEEVRSLVAPLVDQAVACDPIEFVAAVGAGLPAATFLRLVAAPAERFEAFRALAAEVVQADGRPGHEDLCAKLGVELQGLVEARLGEVVEEPALSMRLFASGVAAICNAATFMIHHLARDAELQAVLAAEPARIPDLVEESLRLYGVINGARRVSREVELGGVRMKPGDAVLAMLCLVGRDDRLVKEPSKFNLERSTRPHRAFGAASPVWLALARMQLRLLLEEWRERAPAFRLAADWRPQFHHRRVMSLTELKLSVSHSA